MDKPAIKKFAVWARKKLIADTKYRAGLVGVTETAVAEPLPQSNETVQFFDVGLPQPYRIEGDAVTQRQRFVAELNKETAKQGSYTAAYQTVVDKVAYTWFNRLIAVRYMEVNDLLPSRTRVLSSADGRAEPQIVTTPFDAVLDYTPAEQQQIVALKNDNKLDEAFRLLFLKQCAALGDCLPRLFEQVDDYMPLLLALSFTDKDGVVCHLVNDIPENDWQDAVQIVGWLYQYYNTEPKEQVFANLKKNIKISKENIPAATQLFTPDWIVRYMVENSLGRLWSEGHPDFDKSEWKYYLDEAPQEPQVAQQLAELRKGYAALTPEDIKCIDPCMGSGHILAYLFDVLMQIYTAAGYSKRDAAASIVEHNLYGLDIDDRAAQMAYFVVMMKGCQYDSRFLRRHLNPHVYAIKESNGISTQDSRAMGDFLTDNNYRDTLNYLLAAFANAKEYGSILQLEKRDYAGLLQAWQDTAAATVPNFTMAMWYSAVETLVPQLIRQAILLTQQYDVVVTNPPYMGDLNKTLLEFVKKSYPNSKHDLCSVFIERCLEFVRDKAYVAMITQNAFMFLSRYEKLRRNLLQYQFVNLAHLGAKAFDEISGEVVQTATFCIRKMFTPQYIGRYERLVTYQSEEEKRIAFLEGKNTYYCKNEVFNAIPKEPMTYWVSEKVLKMFEFNRLDEYADPRVGMFTTDNDRFLREWWEPNKTNIGFDYKEKSTAYKSDTKWFPYNKGGGYRRWYGNIDLVVFWQHGGEKIKQTVLKKYPYLKGNYDFVLKTDNPYYHPGITWSGLTTGSNSFRLCGNGFLFDTNKGAMIFEKKLDLEYLLGFLNTKVAQTAINLLNSTISLQIGDVAAIPVCVEPEKFDDIKQLANECVHMCKSDWDSFETSWDFDEHPIVKWSRQLRDATSIGATMAYFYNGERPKVSCPVELCYLLWQGECNDRFAKLKANEEELNRIFIDIYGLQDELTPEVEDKDVTVRRADLARDIRSLISYAVGCIFGRYSLNKAGLVFAGGDFDKIYWKYKGQAALDENGEPIGGGYAGISLAEYHYPKFHDTDDWETATSLTFEPDVDNVIPITDEEYFTDDLTGLFVAWVKKAFGQDYLEENLAFIAKALGVKGTSPRAVIRNYFLNGFYADHVKIYQKRPIYWLYDSGKQNGFKALIYMHRYNADTSGLVRADYLYKMEQVYESEIARMDDAIANGASREVAQATKRKEKLVKQLKECKDYDDRLGHIALARIPIDLDDGVKANYDKVQTGVDGKKLAILAKI